MRHKPFPKLSGAQFGESRQFPRLRSLVAGLTMLELVVAAAVVGLLAAIAIPVLNAVWESLRRSTCANNLRQIGQAMHSYHTTHQIVPPAVIWRRVGEPNHEGRYPIGVIDPVARHGRTDDDPVGANWLVMLLDRLAPSVADAYDFGRSVSADENATVRTAALSVLRCPSENRRFAEEPYCRGSAAGLWTNRYARGNYAINVGPDSYCTNARTPNAPPCVDGFYLDGADLENDNAAVWGSGLAGANRGFSFGDVSDGVSNTIVVSELRTGVDARDGRGAWALGQVGSSALAGHGRSGGCAGPNPPTGFDRLIGCGSIVSQRTAAYLMNTGMPCYPDLLTTEVNTRAAARSSHPHGVNALFCDGSMRFIDDGISVDAWHALYTRDGAETAFGP